MVACLPSRKALRALASSPVMSQKNRRLTELKILLVRLSAIGDVLFATPLIDAFRRAEPDAEIHWLTQPECAPLLQYHPGLADVIVWPRRDWLTLWEGRRFVALAHALAEFRRTLHECRFDLAVDLQGLMKSGLVTRLSGAGRRIGLGSREGSGLLMTQVLPRGGDSRQVGSEYRFLAESLGLPVEDFAMALHIGATETAFAEAQIRRNGLSGGYAVLCPFTTRPQKHWLEPRWAELAGRVRDELGLQAVLLGGPGDRAAAGRIREQTRGDLVDLAGETRLLEAAAMIARARLVIGVDTGLTHMGIALRRPTLALFGSTRPYLDIGRADARILYHALGCSPCRRDPTCEGRFMCMRLITVAECMAAAKPLLALAPT